jgi:hypothetical protein
MMLFSGGASRHRVNFCSLFHKFASFLFHPGFSIPVPQPRPVSDRHIERVLVKREEE